MSLVGENITRPTLPIRILQCIPTMTGGGAERQLVYLCEGLTQLGWDVTVALLDLGPNVERLSRAGIHTEVLTHRTNYDPFLVWQLVDLIRRLRPDVVHTWLPTMNIIGGIAAGLSGTILNYNKPILISSLQINGLKEPPKMRKRGTAHP